MGYKLLARLPYMCDLDHAPLRVLLVYAEAANEQTGRVWLSRATVARRCGMTVDALRHHCKALERQGYLLRTNERGGITGQGTVYRVRLPSIEDLMAREETCEKGGSSSTPFPEKRGQAIYPLSDEKGGSSSPGKGVDDLQERGQMISVPSKPVLNREKRTGRGDADAPPESTQGAAKRTNGTAHKRGTTYAEWQAALAGADPFTGWPPFENVRVALGLGNDLVQAALQRFRTYWLERPTERKSDWPRAFLNALRDRSGYDAWYVDKTTGQRMLTTKGHDALTILHSQGTP